MSEIINELRKTTSSNRFVQDYVKKFIKTAKFAASCGGSYEKVRGDCLVESVVVELEKLGFKRYTKPVYKNGVLQEGPFMTWL